MLNLATRGGQQKTPLTFDEFRIQEGVLAHLQRLKCAGLLLIVTSNQPEVSRGNLARRELDLMHAFLRAQLPIDDILICPHDEADHCPCRKPRPGLLLEAAFKWHLDFGRSYVVSHRWQDAEAARLVGAVSTMVRSPWLGHGHYDLVVPEFGAAVDKIMELARPRCQAA